MKVRIGFGFGVRTKLNGGGFGDVVDVWLGGIAPSELRRVGRLADGWLPSFVTPDDAARGREAVRPFRNIDEAKDAQSDQSAVQNLAL